MIPAPLPTPSHVIEALNWRYATKSFDREKKVSAETLATLLESLRLAPSSFGLQPWRFLVISDAELKQKLFPVSWGNRQVIDCSHLIVLCAPSSIDQSIVDSHMNNYREHMKGSDSSKLDAYEKIIRQFIDGLTDAEKNQWASDQVHIALGTLLSAAATLRVDTCPMGGFQPLEYDRILGLDERGLRSITLCALGYRAVSDPYSTKPKVRFNQRDLFQFI